MAQIIIIWPFMAHAGDGGCFGFRWQTVEQMARYALFWVITIGSPITVFAVVSSPKDQGWIYMWFYVFCFLGAVMHDVIADKNDQILDKNEQIRDLQVRNNQLYDRNERNWNVVHRFNKRYRAHHEDTDDEQDGVEGQAQAASGT